MSFMTSQPLKTDSLHEWLLTPAGQYLLQWEQARVDQAVSDVFGFHALQLGWPELDALQANRMPYRWLGCECVTEQALERRETFLTNYEALPFADASLDLLVLPHSLELSYDPHATLREVARVLVPEGRVVILGFNPNSVWGVQKSTGKGPPDICSSGVTAPPCSRSAGCSVCLGWMRQALVLGASLVGFTWCLQSSACGVCA
jgi:SAM-dependent methyltransferase